MLFVNTMPFTIHHSHHWIGVIGKTCLLNIVLSFVPVCLEIESMQWSTVCLIVVKNKCSESEKIGLPLQITNVETEHSGQKRYEIEGNDIIIDSPLQWARIQNMISSIKSK